MLSWDRIVLGDEMRGSKCTRAEVSYCDRCKSEVSHSDRCKSEVSYSDRCKSRSSPGFRMHRLHVPHAQASSSAVVGMTRNNLRANTSGRRRSEWHSMELQEWQRNQTSRERERSARERNRAKHRERHKGATGIKTKETSRQTHRSTFEK